MKEFKVGERIILEVQEVDPSSNLCTGCFFLDLLDETGTNGEPLIKNVKIIKEL